MKKTYKVRQIIGHKRVHGRIVFLIRWVGFKDPDYEARTCDLLIHEMGKLLDYCKKHPVLTIEKIARGERRTLGVTATSFIGQSGVVRRGTRSSSPAAIASFTADKNAAEIEYAKSLAALSDAAKAEAEADMCAHAGAMLIANIPPPVTTNILNHRVSSLLNNHHVRAVVLIICFDSCGATAFTTRTALLSHAVTWNYFQSQSETGQSIAKSLISSRAAQSVIARAQEAFSRGKPVFVPEFLDPSCSFTAAYYSLHAAVSKHDPSLLPLLERKSLRFGTGGRDTETVNILDFSCGIGGGAKGAHLAARRLNVRLQTLASIDSESLKFDLHNLLRHPCDAKMTPATIRHALGSEVSIKPLRLRGIEGVIGGPMCNPFSPLGNKGGWAAAEANMIEHLDAAQAVETSWIILENSPHLITLDGGKHFKKFKDAAMTRGFLVARWFVFNALEAQGAPPQSRERLAIVLIAKDKIDFLPRILSGELKLLSPSRAGLSTASDILLSEREILLDLCVAGDDVWVTSEGYREIGINGHTNTPVIKKGAATSAPSSFRKDIGWRHMKDTDVSPTLTSSDGSSPLVLARRRGALPCYRHYTGREALFFGGFDVNNVELPKQSSRDIRNAVGASMVPQWIALVFELVIRAFHPEIL